MFGPESRYYRIEDAVYTAADGREITYKKRRFLPRGEDMPQLTELTVREGDTLDHLAATTLGEAVASWRIADANDAMNPFSLTTEPGRVLRVPVPQPSNLGSLGKLG